MTEQEQQIAIAEACGRNGWWCPQCKKLVSEYSLGYQNRHANCTESAQQAPDYLHDLNAMHSAIMSRPIDWRMLFQNKLEARAKAIGKILVELEAADHAECFLQAEREWRKMNA